MSPVVARKQPESLGEAVPIRSPGGDSYRFAPSLVMISSPAEPAAESIRAIRTHVVAQHLDEGRRALAICAASPAVGCTFIAANLSIALSQVGIRTLLIDGDLRNPRLDDLIGSSRKGDGLAQCLASDEISFSDAIRADVLPNLSVMYSGGPSASPQELLGGERFKSLMAFCLRDYEATIVDTPPANTCADARRISTVVGYSLIVTRRHKSFVDDVKALAEQLRADHARVVGTVMNEG